MSGISRAGVGLWYFSSDGNGCRVALGFARPWRTQGCRVLVPGMTCAGPCSSLPEDCRWRAAICPARVCLPQGYTLPGAPVPASLSAAGSHHTNLRRPQTARGHRPAHTVSPKFPQVQNVLALKPHTYKVLACLFATSNTCCNTGPPPPRTKKGTGIPRARYTRYSG